MQTALTLLYFNFLDKNLIQTLTKSHGQLCDRIQTVNKYKNDVFQNDPTGTL